MKIWSWVKSTIFEKHKMAPGWRHEDLMTLKMLLRRLMTMTYDCAINWTKLIKPILKLSCKQKSGNHK